MLKSWRKEGAEEEDAEEEPPVAVEDDEYDDDGVVGAAMTEWGGDGERGFQPPHICFFVASNTAAL